MTEGQKNESTKEEIPSNNESMPTEPPEEVEQEVQSPSDSRVPPEPKSVEVDEQTLQEKLLRTAAELENTRKRARKDAEDALRRGAERVIRDILPVFDNLERALAASTDATDVNSVVEGIQMVLTQFEDAADRLGLKKVQSVGEAFNPAQHEAIQKQPSDEVPAGTVLAEVAPGYFYQGKLLRAAMVVVSEGSPKATQE